MAETSEGRDDEALALYRGPFMDGFHVTGVASDGRFLMMRANRRAPEATLVLIHNFFEELERRVPHR